MATKKRRYLEFEQSLAELDAQIDQLKSLRLQGKVDIKDDIRHLEDKAKNLLKQICSELTPYEKVRLSRHPDRPTALEYIEMVFDDFVEFHGDRAFRDDASIVGGLAKFEGEPVLLVAQQKGRNTQENMERNFGMPRPEGYRKALRLMQLAEQWKIPLLTFVDTPGAFPGIEAEERGQAEAIAKNIMILTDLKAPILTVILGEGGSGGALAIAVCDRLVMLQYSIFSVISPEGCAAIIWKDGAFAADAAKALRVTAEEVQKMKICDAVLEEPLGGAHRDPYLMGQNLRLLIRKELGDLKKQDLSELIKARYSRYRHMGSFAA